MEPLAAMPRRASHKLSNEPEPTPERRENMARVGQKNTKPELIVRRLLLGFGYRYRLHRRDIPGKPDICFIGRKKAIFVHGCFWHRHEGCHRTTTPKTRTSFWEEKFRVNVARDRRKLADLERLGWDALVVWECETKDVSKLESRLVNFLSNEVDKKRK